MVAKQAADGRPSKTVPVLTTRAPPRRSRHRHPHTNRHNRHYAPHSRHVGQRQGER